MALELQLTFDMRWAGLGQSTRADLYAGALDICAWADNHRFTTVWLGEHHGAEDGYNPSTITLAAAVAARTDHLRLRTCIVAPLHDPLRLAEDLAVLDLVSRGRADPLVLGGYRAAEYEMFDRRFEDRRLLVEQTVDVLKSAWTGEPFTWSGRSVRVTPTPCQAPRPPISLGGSIPSVARRAAHIADSFLTSERRLYEEFRSECARIGRDDPGGWRPYSPGYLYVTDDPDRDWPAVAPFAIEASTSYAAWATESFGHTLTGHPAASTIDELKATGACVVVTPEECVELVRGLGPCAVLRISPLFGGLDPDLAWPSLELLASRVLPNLTSQGDTTTQDPVHRGP
jgi:alkanesulfonate monooxygenase SsuD/methylene tetrahydromethanopterin reductase-like flavin-dependent oxidoreductase (luciferase family)